MLKANKLHWSNQAIEILSDKYFQYLEESKLENSFDNCYTFLGKTISPSEVKSYYGLSSTVKLAECLSGAKSGTFSL